MTSPIKSAVAVVALLLSGAAVVWWRARPDATPYTVPPATLEKWTLVTSDGTDPWIVAMKPPDALSMPPRRSRQASR